MESVLILFLAYKGAEAEWGDGLRGLYLSVARYALYQIPQSKVRNLFHYLLCFHLTIPNCDFHSRIRSNFAKKQNFTLFFQSLHTKNYRPQILAFCKYDQKSKTISNPDIVKVARDLKAGKGLSMYASVLEGDILDPESSSEVEECKLQLGSLLREHGCKAFTNILLQKDVPQVIGDVLIKSRSVSLRECRR